MNDPTQAILVWPGVGIGAIVALVWGYKIIPGLYLSQLAVVILLSYGTDEIFNLNEFYISNLFIFVGIFAYYFAAFLIRYIIGFPNALISKPIIFKFFFIVAPLISFVSTFANELLKYSLGFVKTLSLNPNNMNWWFGDLMGFVIFAPLTLIII
ncbi:MAG: MASE1 domain-containing protein, partial [Proteobacteria bacterium]|nr:MASE1 domain-containing protein [Pseudomonadota bacterium]